jgi:NodT family efflux transporter outer membrane factor (OMF) lipoprotein
MLKNQKVSRWLGAWRAVRPVLVLPVLALGGCVVGPSYEGPPATDLHGFQPARAAAPLPGAGSAEPTPAEPTPAEPTAAAQARALPALDTWWTGFNDPALTRIVERALAQNLDLAAAVARVDQARAAAREAGAQLLPEGEFEASVNQLHQSLTGPIGAIAHDLPGYHRKQRLYDAGVGAGWELDLFGGSKRGAEAAHDEAQAAESEHLALRVSIVAEAADAYFQVRGNQSRLVIAQSQVDNDAHLLGLIRLRLAKGASSDKEVAQAAALLSQARATIPPLNTALDGQLNRLDVLMGAQPGTYAAELAQPAAIPALPTIPADQSASDLLRRRPDIIAAERRLAASNARIGVAVAEYYPKISLAGALGFDSLSAGRFFRAESFQPQVTAGLRWRLFDFGRVDAEVAQANSAHRQALLAYRQTILRAALEVENAFTSLAQLQIEIRELGDEVDALRRARDTSQESYLAGASSLTDVLDAERESLVAQDELARARADSDRCAVASFRALGGGWNM